MSTVDEMKEKILAAIEKELDVRGMSQSQLGELIGIPRNKVNNILRGTEKSVSFKRMTEMADALDLNIDVVIKRKRRR